MSDVVSHSQAASQELIAKLVKTGYLQPGPCNDAVAVANAIGRLKQDLRGGTQGCVAPKSEGAAATIQTPVFRRRDSALNQR
jgi:hypothetical protein